MRSHLETKLWRLMEKCGRKEVDKYQIKRENRISDSLVKLVHIQHSVSCMWTQWQIMHTELLKLNNSNYFTIINS